MPLKKEPATTLITDIRARLKGLGNPERAKVLQRFFKTGKGEYAEGDMFLGIAVPEVRKLAREYKNIRMPALGSLLKSPIHEERLLALLVLVAKYAGAAVSEKTSIYRFYLAHTRYINNWDLVDLSAEKIVGDYLKDRDRKPLYSLARSGSLWERRISIMATFHFIKQGGFGDTIRIARIFLTDREDLIHKAAGWMLREVGKRDLPTEEAFLRIHYREMPRTMLRYAIERFPEPERQRYLKGQV